MTQFDFYLINLSFRCPENLELETLQQKIERFAIDCNFIKSHHNEQIWSHHSIYEEILWQDLTISSIINSPEIGEQAIGRFYQVFLQDIIYKTKETNLENEEIIELLAEHDENLINGLLCLHEIEGVDSTYCVYDKNDWYNFHRYFLGEYPISEDYFAQRCQVYFPELYFHPDISHTLGTLEGGFRNFSKAIIYCLSSLNDEFKNYYNPQNIPVSLRKFSSACSIETSNEGDINRRNYLTFNFLDDAGNERSVYCEPHMKLSKSDSLGDSRYYFNRIYFHSGNKSIAAGRILIGHIGRHL